MVADSSNQFDDEGRLKSDLYLKSLTELMGDLRKEIAMVAQAEGRDQT